jgi:hypothetical protein
MTDTTPAPVRPPAARLTASTITDDDLDALYAERDRARDIAAALENELAAAEAELDGRDEEARDRWVQKQLDQTGIRSADFRNGMTMEIEPARELVAHWVGAARAMIGDAPNYTETPIEMHVKVAESPERFAFVLQRVAPGALTPHEARQKAEAERDQHAAAIARVRELHQPTGGHGWKATGGYGDITPACTTCGTSGEYAVPYPCPTIRALDDPTPGGTP